MPATGDGWEWRYFAAAAHGLDRTDGAGDAPGTGVTDSGGPGGPAAPEPTGTGGEPGAPVDGASYGVVVMHVSDDDGRTERADRGPLSVCRFQPRDARFSTPRGNPALWRGHASRCGPPHTHPPQVNSKLTHLLGAWWTSPAIYGSS